MPYIIKERSTHSGRLERWLGTEHVEALSNNLRGWYGPSIVLLDVPGGVRVGGDGDFVGGFTHGRFAGAMDMVRDRAKLLWREAGRPPSSLHTGFASVGDLLSRASGGHRQMLNGAIYKNGASGVLSVSNSLWRVGVNPAAGATPSAAPGGDATTNSTTGAMIFADPASSNLRLTGIEMFSSVAGNSLLLYDRIFHVSKTMSSTGTEAVTGVPTRYQSATATDENYIGGSFAFVEVGGTPLASTAHNWTVCQYTNQAGSGATFPSMAGNSGAIADRLDHPTNSWYFPLASGDVGVKNITQMQCSASLTGTINFVIGHPLGIISFPVLSQLFSADFVTSTNITPKIFDGACPAFMELPKPSSTATNYSGMVYAVAAA